MLDTMSQYVETTHDIRISVVPQYLPEQSEPENSHYVWAYTVVIQNTGQQTMQLINRYWHITDANGQVKEVRGPGVVGEQPILQPGEQFQYTSGSTLHTASGIMRGSYEMEDISGKSVEVKIPAFSLDSPDQFSRPN